MRHPLHIALSVPAPLSVPLYAPLAGPALAGPAPARHRKPSPWRSVAAAVPPARRLAAGLGLVSVLAATALTAAVDPAAPVAPDRVPAGRSSTFAQVSGD
ncbi:hypothetical protein [Streptomyces antarcticus]|uniref:hypothetical protein n=1 Tax=Streptomyces antarcticus TaxID=2996458 RepID=UPI00226EFDB3|nr:MULTISPECIES: hypothetical protein [unclassified Streptomyces]MCY0944444.1 hypothetical protein [Streptomyces sp. H34-AA3]MCZ4082880.1 hypothetical protein [Streptomyces sp. H34-S5]